MALLLHFVLLLSPETERLLLGPSPFFRHEGMERARREGDFDLLIKAAQSPYWDARQLAAEGLGSKTPHKLLEDPVAVVREAAVRALDITAPEPQLVKLLKDPDDAVRAEAAWALRATSKRSNLTPLLKDRSPAVRVAALAATGNMSRLKTLAFKREIGTAVAALRAMGRAGGPSEASFLFAKLKRAATTASKSAWPIYLRDEPSSDLALARAVGDLARRGLSVAGKPLSVQLQALVRKLGVNGSHAILLAEAVAGARDAESARLILDAQLEARKKSTLPSAVLAPALSGVLHAFSREPWPELAPLLLPMLDHRSPDVRAEAARALVGNAARPALRDRSPVVRAIACANVGSLSALLTMVKDPDPAVLAATARALGKLGDPKAAAILETLLVHKSPRVRRAAVGALLRVDMSGRIDALVRVGLQDVSVDVRRTAAAVILFLQEQEAALTPAIDALDDEQRVRRERAIEFVHALTPARLGYDPAAPERGYELWNDWLKRKRERPKKTGGFQYHVEDLRRRGIDLVLVVDATSSMSGLIQATKRKLEHVVTELRRIVPDLRARIVFYRDRGDAFLTVGSPLTHDVRTLEDFIACVPAWGGGDPPEGVMAGLREAIGKTPWRGGAHKIVVLFGDAPPHPEDMALLEADCKEFKGVIHTVDVGNYGQGGVGSVMSAFRKIAQWGRGSSVPLADEHALLRNLLVLTLGPNYRVAVETLFGL